jgi:hypothetical protein
LLPGPRLWSVWTEEAQFAAAEQFPFDFLARLQADCGGKGDRDVDVGPGFLSFRTNSLNFYRIFCLRRHELAYRLFIIRGFANPNDGGNMSLARPKVQRTLFDVPVLIGDMFADPENSPSQGRS